MTAGVANAAQALRDTSQFEFIEHCLSTAELLELMRS
jgi:hypothetical protein